MPNLYEIGVRRVTLRFQSVGKEEQLKTVDLEPPSLSQQIKGRDPAVRKTALDKERPVCRSRQGHAGPTRCTKRAVRPTAVPATGSPVTGWGVSFEVARLGSKSESFWPKA